MRIAVAFTLGLFVLTMPACEPPSPPGAVGDVANADFVALLDELIEQYQPRGTNLDEPNGYTLLVDATVAARNIIIELSDASPTDDVDFTVLYSVTWTPRGDATHAQTAKLTRAALDRIEHAGVLEQLDRLVTTRRAVRPRPDSAERAAQLAAYGVSTEFDGRITSNFLPDLGGARNLVRMCAARMAIAAEIGDVAALERSFAHGMAISRMLAHQPTLIDRTVANAARNLMLGQAISSARDLRVTDATLQRLLEIADEQTVDVPPFELCVEGERIHFFNICHWGFDAKGRLKADTLPRETEDEIAMASGRVQQVTRMEAVRLGNKYFDDLRDAVASEKGTRLQRILRLENRLRLPETPAEDFAFIFTPSFKGGYGFEYAGLIHRDGFRAAVAIERYRRTYEGYPESLQQLLDVGILTAHPQDPLSSIPLGYVRHEDAAPEEWGYTLYALGIDGEDNGGNQLDEEGVRASDVLINFKKGAGFDYVIAGGW